MDDILVSIVCITYNHENYIGDAIEGFINQDVNFKYEVLIHDDCSTDRTAEIIKEYENAYPDLIKGFYEEENQNSKGVKLLGMFSKIAKGKYVAICEGDDYWIAKDKLQIQVDFLESHPEYAMTMHSAAILDCRSNKISTYRTWTEDREISAREMITLSICNGIPTASIMVKKEVYSQFASFPHKGIGDRKLHIAGAAAGKIYYMDRIMALYRYCLPGSWTIQNDVSEHGRFMLFCNSPHYTVLSWYDKYTEGKFHEYVENAQSQLYMRLLNRYLSGDGYEV